MPGLGGPGGIGDRPEGDAALRTDPTLSEQRGTPIILVFYPRDNGAICTRQLCAYTSQLARFAELGAVVWGISPQDLDSHEAFARSHNLGFPLLSDANRVVAKEYGVTTPGLGVNRAVFILDSLGVIRWKHV